MFPEFEFFGRTIGTYGICSILGLAACVIVLTFTAKKYKYTFDDVILMTLVVCGGLFVGAHLLYGVTNISSIVYLFSQIGNISFLDFCIRIGICFGGMVYYGGFIGGGIALLIYTCKKKKADRPHMLDFYAMTAPLFHAFGRIGCFLGGCCYGKEWSWGFYIEENHLNPSIAGVTRFPVQLFEAGFNLLIFFAILILFSKRKLVGKLIYVYMLIYPIVRFTLEFFRGDEIRGFLFGLSTSQWISIGLFIFAAIMLPMSINKENKLKKPVEEELSSQQS